MGLTWRDPLYMDAGMEKKINRIRWRLEHGAGSFRLYLVTISTSPGMQLDIVSAAELKQRVIRRCLPMIVGVAGSYEDALDRVQDMLADALAATGTPDIRKYLENRQE